MPVCKLRSNFLDSGTEKARNMFLTDLEAAKKNEWERRRKLRIQQVRQQSKDIANALREKVKCEQSKLIDNKELQKQAFLKKWEARRIEDLQKKYHKCLEDVGQAHVQAAAHPDVNEFLKKEREINDACAAIRGQNAMDRLQFEKQKCIEKDMADIKRKKLIREKEDYRSHLVASLPLPIPIPPTRSNSLQSRHASVNTRSSPYKKKKFNVKPKRRKPRLLLEIPSNLPDTVQKQNYFISSGMNCKQKRSNYCESDDDGITINKTVPSTNINITSNKENGRNNCTQSRNNVEINNDGNEKISSGDSNYNTVSASNDNGQNKIITEEIENCNYNSQSGRFRGGCDDNEIPDVRGCYKRKDQSRPVAGCDVNCTCLNACNTNGHHCPDKSPNTRISNGSSNRRRRYSEADCCSDDSFDSDVTWPPSTPRLRSHTLKNHVPVSSRVEYYDHNNRFYSSSSRSKAAPFVTKLHHLPNNVASAELERLAVEDKVSKTELLNDKQSKRGVKAVERQKLKDDFQQLIGELSKLDKKERKLRYSAMQTCNNDGSVHGELRRKKLMADRQKKMESAVISAIDSRLIKTDVLYFNKGFNGKKSKTNKKGASVVEEIPKLNVGELMSGNSKESLKKPVTHLDTSIRELDGLSKNKLTLQNLMKRINEQREMLFNDIKRETRPSEFSIPSENISSQNKYCVNDPLLERECRQAKLIQEQRNQSPCAVPTKQFQNCEDAFSNSKLDGKDFNEKNIPWTEKLSPKAFKMRNNSSVNDSDENSSSSDIIEYENNLKSSVDGINGKISPQIKDFVCSDNSEKNKINCPSRGKEIKESVNHPLADNVKRKIIVCSNPEHCSCKTGEMTCDDEKIYSAKGKGKHRYSTNEVEKEILSANSSDREESESSRTSDNNLCTHKRRKNTDSIQAKIQVCSNPDYCSCIKVKVPEPSSIENKVNSDQISGLSGRNTLNVRSMRQTEKEKSAYDTANTSVKQKRESSCNCKNFYSAQGRENHQNCSQQLPYKEEKIRIPSDNSDSNSCDKERSNDVCPFENDNFTIGKRKSEKFNNLKVKRKESENTVVSKSCETDRKLHDVKEDMRKKQCSCNHTSTKNLKKKNENKNTRRDSFSVVKDIDKRKDESCTRFPSPIPFCNDHETCRNDNIKPNENNCKADKEITKRIKDTDEKSKSSSDKSNSSTLYSLDMALSQLSVDSSQDTSSSSFKGVRIVVKVSGQKYKGKGKKANIKIQHKDNCIFNRFMQQQKKDFENKEELDDRSKKELLSISIDQNKKKPDQTGAAEHSGAGSSSTSYLSPPDHLTSKQMDMLSDLFKKIENQDKQKGIPLIKQYILRLLHMSRESIDRLDVSSSDVSIHSSIFHDDNSGSNVNGFSKTMEKTVLENNDVSSTMVDQRDENCVYNNLDVLRQHVNKYFEKNMDSKVKATKEANDIVDKYAELAKMYAKRISSLAEMIGDLNTSEIIKKSMSINNDTSYLSLPSETNVPLPTGKIGPCGCISPTFICDTSDDQHRATNASKSWRDQFDSSYRNSSEQVATSSKLSQISTTITPAPPQFVPLAQSSVFDSKPPPSLLNGKMRLCTPHELSAIQEVDTPTTSRVHNSMHSLQQCHTSNTDQVQQPIKEDKLDEIILSDDKIEDINLSFLTLQSHDDDDNSEELVSVDSEELGSLPDIMNELLRRGILTSPFGWAKKKSDDNSSEDDNDKNSCDSKKRERYSFLDDLSSSQMADEEVRDILKESSPEDIESAFDNLGLGWASTTLRKTREANELSGDSNSSIDLNSSFKNNACRRNVNKLETSTPDNYKRNRAQLIPPNEPDISTVKLSSSSDNVMMLTPPDVSLKPSRFITLSDESIGSLS